MDSEARVLERALNCVAALPLDTLPSVGVLPAASRIPLPRNPLFLAGEAALLAMVWTIHPGSSAANGGGAIAVVTGMGGIGKA